MQIVNLFLTQSKEWITNIDLLEKLRKLKADECEILYIHSALSFGTPNPDSKRITWRDLRNFIDIKGVNHLYANFYF